METISVPAGAEVYLGAPARPMPASVSVVIRQVVSQTPGVLEAHLPQCYIPGVIDPSAQVLVIVLDSRADRSVVAGSTGEALSAVLPHPSHIQLWLLGPDHEILPAVRAAGCQIAGPATPAKPRWKFWM
jgi:hypothetical protein